MSTTDESPEARRPRASNRCRLNALRIGHCAPTVLWTLLEQRGRLDPEMVRCIAGLAGGIGGPGECGGICSPLLVFGLHSGQELSRSEELPRTIPLGQEYMRRFLQVHGSRRCADISSKGLRPCLNAMCTSSSLMTEVSSREAEVVSTFPAERRAAHLALLRAFDEHRLCGQVVFDELGDLVRIPDELQRASWVFSGGMVLSGLTCGALVAGVMAISSQVGGVERSYLRTLKMALFLVLGLNERALRDETNAGNRALRLAGSLAQAFEKEYGTTRCRELTGADFGTSQGVERFCATGLSQCAERARRVAVLVREVLR